MASTRFLLVLFTALSLSALAQQSDPSSEQRVAHWREDLQFLQSRYSAKGESVDMLRGISSRGQKDFEKLYPTFPSAIAELESDLPRLSDGEVVLRLMKIVASAHVAHNTVLTRIGNAFFERLPLSLRWYGDGLAISGAAADYQNLLGARIVKVGNLTPEQALAAVAPYISHENDTWLRQQSEQFLRWGIVLKQIGVTNSDGGVSLTVQKPGTNTPLTVTVATIDPRAKLISLEDALRLPAAFAHSHPGKYYWYEYLKETETLFIQYNKCENDSKLKFSDFAREVMAAADRNSVKRVVIDLRFNGGGDSRVIAPLKTGLEQRRGKTGPLYVLIGANTFSSGTDNALELKRDHAVLVGAPTGGKPSSYGEVKYVTLPYSKLVVQYTSKWFGSHGNAQPDALVPDVTAAQTLADVLAGRDTALEAVLTSNLRP